jgi:hypothetical protein
LSNNFETGGDGICSGNEVNLVRSLAAGGIKDTSGYSNVMYAGTDGLGPLAPTGGHIWVSTNVDSAAWFDRTGAINPGKFPISVGVFSSSTGTASWTEVGPASGQAGFLPNVSVTALRMFNSGGNKILRASTYGRGVWQLVLTSAPA